MMINSIDGIIEHSQTTLLIYPPEIREEMIEDVVFSKHGCLPEEVLRLKSSAPELPDSYLHVLSQLSLHRKGLLGIELSPGPARLSYIDQIIFQSRTPFSRDSGFCAIGHKDADLILLQKSSALAEGGQISILIGDSKREAHFLAPSFMDFLFICANLEERFPDRGVPSRADECTKILESFGASGAFTIWEYLINS